MLTDETRQLCRLFAEALDYPSETTPEAAGQCLQGLKASFSESAKPMRSFISYINRHSTGALKEEYTRTFDVVPARTLYAGYHLFGENPKRSTLMIRLEEAYMRHGFSRGTELPDHLCVLLRFLSVAEEPEFVSPLLRECLLPALDNIEADFKKDKSGYGSSVKALKLFLKKLSADIVKTGGAA